MVSVRYELSEITDWWPNAFKCRLGCYDVRCELVEGLGANVETPPNHKLEVKETYLKILPHILLVMKHIFKQNVQWV